MKKKVIIVISIICVIIVCVCLGIILVNLNNENDLQQTDEVKQDNIVSKENGKNEEEKKESVALDSKIGSEVLSKILMPNIYSKIIYNELDKNGISNDFKIMYTFSLMTNYQEYSSYLREGEDYIGSYITKDDLEEVASTIFENVSNLEHKAVLENDTYNKETGNYVVVARGYAGSNFDYVVEVPYEITEYNNKITVKSYRVYVHREYDMEKEDLLPEDKVYTDAKMENLVSSISDEKMLDEIDGQKDILKYLIEEGKINKEYLDISTWTLVKRSGEYLISEYSLDKE